MKKEIWLPLCAIVLVAAVILGCILVPYEGASTPVIAVLPLGDVSESDATEAEEMRGIWVPYMSLTEVTPEKIDTIVDDAQLYGYNAIFFHVRPFGDALYDSEYFPSSHLFDGTQGGEVSFDPLAYVIEVAHAKGIEVHAWINPFRIQHYNGTMPSELSQDNPYYIFRNDSDESNDCYVIDYKSGKFFNPGEAGAREYIIKGICEIVENYDVDGIHWDDYFYPADDESFDDSESYSRYLENGGELTLLEWRTENINTLVRDSYKAIKEINSDVVFGISPQGNIGNCLNMGADVYEWCSQSGYVDYTCPQIYWSFDHATAQYDKMCRKWKELVTSDSVELYIGLALYKAGSDSDDGTWQGSDDILAQEVRYARGEEIVADGFIVYSYEYLNKSATKEEVSNLTDELLLGKNFN